MDLKTGNVGYMNMAFFNIKTTEIVPDKQNDRKR